MTGMNIADGELVKANNHETANSGEEVAALTSVLTDTPAPTDMVAGTFDDASLTPTDIKPQIAISTESNSNPLLASDTLKPSSDDIAVVAYAAPMPPQGLAASHFEKHGAIQKVGANSAELDSLIEKYSSIYQVPVKLVRRVVKRESNFDPTARNKIYWGLMQIRHDTAGTMGYRGPASGLLDAETNLKYAVKYLRGAYLTADRNEDHAVRLYARGYYYDAKRKGLLKITGLRP